MRSLQLVLPITSSCPECRTSTDYVHLPVNRRHEAPHSCFSKALVHTSEQAAPSALALESNIILVDQVVDGVCALGHGSQVRHLKSICKIVACNASHAQERNKAR